MATKLLICLAFSFSFSSISLFSSFSYYLMTSYHGKVSTPHVHIASCPPTCILPSIVKLDFLLDPYPVFILFWQYECYSYMSYIIHHDYISFLMQLFVLLELIIASCSGLLSFLCIHPWFTLYSFLQLSKSPSDTPGILSMSSKSQLSDLLHSGLGESCHLEFFFTNNLGTPFNSFLS